MKLETFLQTALSEAVSPAIAKEPGLRASAVPFCPILNMAQSLAAVKEPVQKVDYAGQFYTGIGTVVHTHWQASIVDHPMLGEHVFGNWVCQGCGKEVSKTFRPRPCDCHYPWWRYKELSLRYRSLTGHCDMLFRDPDDGWTLLDLKTATTHHVEKTKTAKPPHILQIRCYAYLLEKEYDIEIRRVALVYQAREYHAKFIPVSVVWDDHQRARIKRKLDYWCDNYSLARAALRGEAPLRQVAQARPCHTLEDYDREMAAAFYFTTCQFRGVCCVNRGKGLKPLLTGLVDEYRKLKKERKRVRT